MAFDTVLAQERIDRHTQDGHWVDRTITDSASSSASGPGDVVSFQLTLAFADMTRFLAEKGVAKQYCPERLELLAELPRTASGKIQKFRLREQLGAGPFQTR
jgi:acyl-CoA synthetase (AMP-forming)/AMP-acid ligase II